MTGTVQDARADGKWDESAFDPAEGPQTIPALLEESARLHGDELFIVAEDGQRLTFAETRALARQAARAFIAAGLAKGERVAIWAPNCTEWIIACLGLQLAGGIMVPLNTRYKGEEAAYILEKSGAVMLCMVRSFVGNDYPTLLREARGGPSDERPVSGLPALRRIVMMEGEDWQRFLAESDAVSEAALDTRIATITPDDLSDILFTSGTTGHPKGAMFNHRQCLFALRTLNFVTRLEPGDHMVVVPPFFHNFGYRAGWLAALECGVTAYLVGEFRIESLMNLIEREHITTVPAPPNLLQAIVDHRDLGDTSSLRAAGMGAAVIDPQLLRDCHDKLGMEVVITSYGLTEHTGLGSANRCDADVETRANTVGKPFPGTELRVVDRENRVVPTGEPGEVCFHGPLVMQGYLDDPEATAATIDAEGWLHTGDIGVLDENGNLRIVDRLKDIVIVGGFNAYPAEIEAILAEAPGIAEVAVVGMPDKRLGEVCVAFVVSKPDATLDKDLLHEWSREHMANFKVPRRFFQVDAMPRTPLGKVRRVELRQRAAEEAAAG